MGNKTSNACFTAAYESDDSEENYFVLAVRPGGDGANPTSAKLFSGIKVNSTWVSAANLCVLPQANQVDDEMDYNCGVINGTVQVTSSVDNATTVEIYAGFANGDAFTASAV